jgi:multisubunit Na+/H+ antiporter MnhE subunit
MSLARINSGLSFKSIKKGAYLLYLFLYFCYKIIESGWAVGWMILKGSRGDKGGVVEYNTIVQKSWHLVLLFNMLSMTPGSLSVDISENGSIIEVHLLNLSEKEQFIMDTRKIESLLMKAL